MSESAIVQRAEALAYLAHHDVKNKFNGEPYIAHPKRVVGHLEAVAESLGVFVSDEMVAAAWLHDAYEDVSWVTADVITGATNPEVTAMVLALSRNYGPEAEYYPRIRDWPQVRVVKMADIKDNTDPTRLAVVPPAKRAKFVAKYAVACHALGVDHPWS